MELKSYQYKVVKELEIYLEYLQQYKIHAVAFDKVWSDRIGPYNSFTGEGMEPYKNTILTAPHVCIKVPTAGGKTFIACNALHSIFKASSDRFPKAVVWLVPWSNLLQQTISNLRNPDHPYRQKLNSLFNNRVEVYDKKDVLQGTNFNAAVVKEQLSIIVMSFSSLRAKNKEDRKVYQQNGSLASFAAGYANREFFLPDTDDTALINVIRSLHPVLVVDESHNAESELSVEMLKSVNPSFIVDLTATPKENSNIISLVPAIELKKEHMVKLPVIVYNHPDKTEVINSALHLQKKLEKLSIELEKSGGKYIRPIVLFQAQPKTGDSNTTFEKLKELLLKANIPEEQVKIKTAEIDELKGQNLLAKTCPVRYIITVNALKEGWDCPFAYVLASLADKSAAVDVEQILGRILRQPYVMNHTAPQLNMSYVLTASAKFHETLQNIVKGLQSSGFSEKDYRYQDSMHENEKTKPILTAQEKSLFSGNSESDDIDLKRISYNPGEVRPESESAVIREIELISKEQQEELEKLIEEHREQPIDENLVTEMGIKVKRYERAENFKQILSQIGLPQFFLQIQQSEIFFKNKVLLNQESLLKNFRLSNEDSKIEFADIASDLYKIDLEQINNQDHDSRFTKIEEEWLKDPVVDYILARPLESQIKDIAHQLIRMFGNMYPMADQDIRRYIERILGNLTAEQLQDILVRRISYAEKIKIKIKQHADAHAEMRFNDLIKIGKIFTEQAWSFPERIVPGILGPPIAKSLYEREAEMNEFEAAVITNISSLPNILFWHRNLGKGKGFAINGYKSNHYPDFIVYSKSGNIIVIETKGDDRDNSDSAAKCRLGNTWASLAGKLFSYFMIFDKKAIDGAYNADKAKELIRQL